jgi:hypothetical protein
MGSFAEGHGALGVSLRDTFLMDDECDDDNIKALVLFIAI